MIEEKERAAKFVRAIQREGAQRRATIEQQLDAQMQQELETATMQAQKRAAEMQQYECTRLQQSTNRALSQAMVQTGETLAQKRNEITAQVFAQCRQEISRFVQSEQYKPFLQKRIQRLLQALQTEQAQFFASQRDLPLVQQLVGSNSTVTADAKIQLGGLRALAGAIQLDDTLDAKLQQQMQWFLQHSGMSIAL